MSSPIAAVAGIGGTADPTASLQIVDLPASGHPAPSTSDAAHFAQEVSHMQEVQASRASAAQTIGQDLTQKLQGLSEHLQGLRKPASLDHAQSAAGGHGSAGAGGANMVSSDAMTQLQGVYAFAIETTLASRGSTESTKIFNTLLKGQ